MVRAAAGALRLNFTRPSTMQLQRAGEASHRSSDSIKPAAFVRGEPAFPRLRRVPASAPAIARSFHAWPHALPRIRPLLADPLAAAFRFS
jgi:hypothetical protein